MFIKYSSITNSFNEDFINCVRDTLDKNTQFTVREKLHGANFSFLLDSTREIKHCSRNRVLNMQEGFSNHQELKKYHSLLLEMYDEYTLPGSTMQVYGEFAGKGIQKGVNYGDKDFYCFDIKIDGTYIDLDEVDFLCTRFNIKMPPYLMTGTLDECLNHSNEFNSKVLNIEDNICEGIVISPVIPRYLDNGDRIIIKSKNEKFAEKSSAKRRIHKPKKTLAPSDLASLDLLTTYLTQNRVDNVASKEPINSFGKFLGAVSKDALSDCAKENPNIDFSNITKEFNKLVANFIRPTFLKRKV